MMAMMEATAHDIRKWVTLRTLSKVTRPSSTAAADAHEVVVGQDHVGGFASHIGPRTTHGHTDGRGLEGGRVVHAVAGYRDDLAGGLERPHDAQLVLGGHPGVDGNTTDQAGELCRVHVAEILAP